MTLIPHAAGRAIYSGRSLPALQLHARAVAQGDSITAGSNGPTYLQFAQIATRGRLYWPSGYNQGTGGKTASTMVGQVGAVTALAPKIVFFLAGTNDLGGTGNSVAQIFADLRSNVRGFLNAGARVVQLTVMRRSDATWTGLGAQRELDRQALNALIKAQRDIGLIVVDTESLYDPTTMSVGDQLHPAWQGAINMGLAAGAAANKLLAATDPLFMYTDGTNLAPNPNLTGVTGTKSGTGPVTGNVADIWGASENGGMAVACSIVTMDGANAQRLVVSGTNSTAGRVVNFSKTVSYSGAIGDVCEAWIEFSLASGAQNLRSICLSCDTASQINGSSTFLMPSGQALSGVIRTPIGTPLAATRTTQSLQAFLTFAAGTVAADITWGKPFLRKAPTSQ